MKNKKKKTLINRGFLVSSLEGKKNQGEKHCSAVYTIKSINTDFLSIKKQFFGELPLKKNAKYIILPLVSKEYKMSVLVEESLSKNVDRNLHGINGYVDYRRLREQLGIRSIKLAKAIGKTQRYLQKNPQAEGIQKELRKLAYLMVLLKEMLGSREEISIWLNSPNPDYDGLTPLEIITQGKIDSLTRYLEDIQKGSLT